PLPESSASARVQQQERLERLAACARTQPRTASDLARPLSDRPLAAPESMLVVETRVFVSFLVYLSVTALAWPACRSSLTQVAKTLEQAWLVRHALIHSRRAVVARWDSIQVWGLELLGLLRLFAGCPRAVARLR